MTNNKHDEFEWMHDVDTLGGPSCGYCMFQSLDHFLYTFPCQSNSLSYLCSSNDRLVTPSIDMPTAVHDSMSRPYSGLDMPLSTEVESSDLKEDRAHWGIHGGEDQPLMPETNNVVQSAVYEHDELGSTRSSTGLRAQRMSMGSIEE